MRKIQIDDKLLGSNDILYRVVKISKSTLILTLVNVETQEIEKFKWNQTYQEYYTTKPKKFYYISEFKLT